VTPGSPRRDIVTLEILRSSLVTLTEEMGLAMGRAAHSPIFNEGRDYSCAVFDGKGEMIAQAAFDPLHLGAMPFAVEYALALKGGELEPGDVLLANDPYNGGSHLPDFTMMMPVFVDGEIVAICANRAHQVDVGGTVPGSFYGEATEICQEGLRLPPVHFHREGELVDDTWQILLSNVRDRESSRGDLHAMFGSLSIGARRVEDLVAAHGKEVFVESLEEIKDYSERRMRAEIEEIPDGSYQFVNWLENDGHTADPLAIAVTVTIDGSEAIVDFTGSSPQARGPVNAPYAVTASNVYCPFLEVVSPDIPTNHGCYRPITVIAPPGTVVNPLEPAPVVGGNVETSARINEAVLGALTQVMPERTIAASHGTYLNMTGGGTDPRTGTEAVFYIYSAGGWGGRADRDGNSAVMGTWSNDRQSSIEANEQAYPMLFRRFSLTERSAGAGRHRGGFGTTMVIEVTTDRMTVSLLSERCQSSPFGLFGGEPPEPRGNGLWNQVTFELADGRRGTAEEIFGKSSSSKWGAVVLGQGDVIEYMTVGGAGYGPPADRDPAASASDRTAGYLGAEER